MWTPIKGQKFTIKEVDYVVSQNAWSLSREFEYMNKENGKKYISTIAAFDEGVVSGLIQL